MLTLTATLADFLAPTVTIEIHSDTNLTTLYRSDRNGIAPVRARLTLSDSVAIIDDYEPAYGTVTYSAENKAGETSEQTLTISGSLPILHHTAYPTQYVQVTAITDYSHTRTSGTIVQQGLTNAYPSVTYSVMRSREIELIITASSYQKAAEIERVLATPGIVMVRQAEHNGLDAYLAITNIAITPSVIAGTATIWQITCQGKETARPAGAPTQSATNSYGTYLDIYPLYIDSSTNHDTYIERLKNE